MSKIRVTLTGVAVLSLAVLAFISLSGGATKLSDEEIARARVRAQVFELCNYSRTIVNGEVEEMCGNLQDSTNTEYKCRLRNKSPLNHCWVEDK